MTKHKKSTVTTIPLTLALFLILSAKASVAIPFAPIHLPVSGSSAGVETGTITIDEYDLWTLANEPMFGSSGVSALGIGSVVIDGVTYDLDEFTAGINLFSTFQQFSPGDFVHHGIGEMSSLEGMLTGFSRAHGKRGSGHEGEDSSCECDDGHEGSGDCDDSGYYDDGDEYGEDCDDGYGDDDDENAPGIPEPSTVLLFSLGAAGLGISRFRRRKGQPE